MKNCYHPIIAIIAIVAQSCFAEMDSTHQECSIPNNVPLQPSLEQWQTIRGQLTPMMDKCLNSSEYFALLGASQLYTGETTSAIEMLERALLINPKNGSATVDYALALYRRGQLQSALQVNNQLLTRQDLPANIRRLLELRSKQWEEQTRFFKNQVSYQYGHSSNLNNATYLKEINGLADFGRAESGNFHQTRLISQFYQLEAQGASLMSFRIASRDSHLEESDSDEISFDYEEDFETLDLRTNINLGAEHLRIGDESSYNSLKSTVSLHPRNSSSYLVLEGRYIYFYTQDDLDELSFKFQPGIKYTFNTSRIGLELGLEYNSALKDRRGGDRVKRDVSVYYDTILGGGRLAARVSYTETEDLKPYQPFFGYYDERSIDYWTGSIQYIYPISKDIILQSGYYYRKQESNIDLFKTETENISLGLTYQF